MGMEQENRRLENYVNPANWRLGASISLNNWDAGLVEIRQYRDAGIKEIELAWRNDMFDMFDPINEARCGAWIEEVRSLHMNVWSLHLPFGPLFDVSEPDAAASEAIIARHARLMKLAHNWNIRTVILHPSWEPITDEERPSRIEACRNALAALAEAAHPLGITIAVECLPRTCLGNHAAEMKELIALDERIGICCDVNHLFKEAPERFIGELGQRIVTVHMSDNDGVDECHWVPGKGVINWTAVIQELSASGYAGPFLFEVRHAVPSELQECWSKLQ